jgi:hypothetical protein
MYCNETVDFKWGQYTGGQIALQLFSKHGPEMTVTSNMPDHQIGADEIVIKDYSENEGILNELIRLEIVEKPNRYASSGFVRLAVCKLKINPKEN